MPHHIPKDKFLMNSDGLIRAVNILVRDLMDLEGLGGNPEGSGSLSKFDHLAEKFEQDSISNLSTNI